MKIMDFHSSKGTYGLEPKYLELGSRNVNLNFTVISKAPIFKNIPVVLGFLVVLIFMLFYFHSVAEIDFLLFYSACI